MHGTLTDPLTPGNNVSPAVPATVYTSSVTYSHLSPAGGNPHQGSTWKFLDAASCSSPRSKEMSSEVLFFLKAFPIASNVWRCCQHLDLQLTSPNASNPTASKPELPGLNSRPKSILSASQLTEVCNQTEILTSIYSVLLVVSLHTTTVQPQNGLAC